MKRLDQLTQLTAAQLAQDDIIGIRDQSAGQTKYITVKDLTGSPDFGWTATGESHTYSSWDSIRRIGVITVPTDATTKYSKKMRYRFSQTTGGTKYAIIVGVTSTTLTLLLPAGITLNNEAITSPVYTGLAEPLGFPVDAASWTFELAITTQINMGSIALAATVTNITGASLALGPGLYDIEFYCHGQIAHAGTSFLQQTMGISTSNNSFSDRQLVSAGPTISTASTQQDGSFSRRKRIDLAANTTYYLNTQSGNAANCTQYANGSIGTTVIRAVSAYL